MARISKEEAQRRANIIWRFYQRANGLITKTEACLKAGFYGASILNSIQWYGIELPEFKTQAQIRIAHNPESIDDEIDPSNYKDDELLATEAVNYWRDRYKAMKTAYLELVTDVSLMLEGEGD